MTSVTIECVSLRQVNLPPKVLRTDAIQSFVTQETILLTLHCSDGIAATGYAYTIGLNESFSFPDIVIFGLAPVAVKGLIDLVIEQVTSGVEIPRDVPLVGLLDNDLRCVFSTVDVTANAHLFTTGVKWNRGKVGAMLQLVWPDRNGLLPFESGFDASMRLAQPAIGIAPTL